MLDVRSRRRARRIVSYVKARAPYEQGSPNTEFAITLDALCGFYSASRGFSGPEEEAFRFYCALEAEER